MGGDSLIYVFDKTEKLIAILRPDSADLPGAPGSQLTQQAGQYLGLMDDGSPGSPGACPYYNAVHKEQLNGTQTLEFALPGDHPEATYVTEQALVAFRDEDQNWRLFEVKRVIDLESSLLIKAVYCEPAYLEMLDDHIEDLRPADCSAAFALTQALSVSRWEAGTVDDLGINSARFFRENPISAISKIIGAWGGELRYRVTITANAITGRYVDLLARRGANTGKRFEYGKDMAEIERTVEASGVKTALYGYGKGEEAGDGYGRRINFSDIVWSMAGGDPVDKPAGQSWVGDPAALIQWGRPGGRHRFGQFENPDITDPAELLRLTWAELQKRKEPLISYKMTVTNLESISGLAHEAVRLGDTVGCINRDMALRVTARVVELQRNLNSPDQSVVILGNFLPNITEDSKRLRELATQLHDKSGIWDDKLKAGAIQTSWLEGVIDTLQNEVRSSLGYVYQTDEGITAYDKPIDQNPTKAIRIGGGLLAIANSKNAQGEWEWRTFGTGDGFTADQITTGKLLASILKIEGYNGVWIDAAGGVRVLDDQSRQRAQLGQYAEGKFGLELRDMTGETVVLDEDGLMQTWQEGQADNVDATNGLELELYIPPETKAIHRALLRFKLKEFRAYETGAASGGSTTSGSSSSTTTDSDGATTSGSSSASTTGSGESSISITTMTLGTSPIDTTTSAGGHTHTAASAGGHTHVLSSHNHVDSLQGATGYNKDGIDAATGHTHSTDNPGTHIHSVYNHTHPLNIGSHTHGIAHTHSIANHTHGMGHTHSIASHSHGLTFGIYKGARAASVGVTINGVDRTAALGGPFSTDQNGLNIAAYLSIGAWNTIAISSTGLGRIDAKIFIQALMGV